MTPNFSLPDDLNRVASAWRSHIRENVEITMEKNLDRVVPGTTSVYHLTMAFYEKTVEEPKHVLHYAGQTGDPSTRANSHKTELRNCKTTTFTGKSAVYSPKYFEGVNTVQMSLTVVQSGLTVDEAKNAEQALAEDLRRLFGDESVLTKPTGKKVK